MQVAALTAARQSVAGAISAAFSLLNYRGHFADPTRTAVSQGVLPGLLAAVSARVARADAAASAVDSALAGALTAGAAAYGARLAAEADMAREYPITAFVRLPAALSKGLVPGEAVVGGGAVPTITEAEVESDEDDDDEEDEDGVSPRKARRLAAAGAVVLPVGPVIATKRDSVEAVEERLFEWISSAAAATGSPTADGMTRVLELGLGRPLRLHMRGTRLPGSASLLAGWALEQLRDLELRPDPEAATGVDTHRG